MAAGLVAYQRRTGSRAARSNGGRRPSSARNGSSKPPTRSISRGRARTAARSALSPLEKLGITIRLEDAAQRYQTANFRNGTRPSNAISFEKPLNREQLASNRAMIESLHKGVDQTGKTILLSGGATIQSLSMTAVEASLIEQRRLDREEIAIVFGLSGPSLTDSTNSALGNVAERFRAFYRDVLPPWTTLVAATVEAQLLDPEPAWMGRLVRFDFTRQAPRRTARAGREAQDARRGRHDHPRRGPPGARQAPGRRQRRRADGQREQPGDDRRSSTGHPHQRPHRNRPRHGSKEARDGRRTHPRRPPRRARRRRKAAEEQRIPYARFEEVNTRAKHAEKELEDLRQRIVDFEERDKSEAERAQARANRAEPQLAQLQSTVTAMQKGSWVRSAATELEFHDPEDAVAHLQEKLARLEDERDAKRMVKSLAQSKKHLVRGDEPKDERPRIGRCSAPTDARPAGNGQQPATREQVVAQREAEFAHSLADELNKFRAGWREMGGITP